jgi:hypothetical protein
MQKCSQNARLETMSDIPLPQPFWKSWTFILFVLFCLLLILPSIYIFFLRPVPLIISEKTTRITGPLTEKGEIDFFKALEERFYPPELATDDNGFRVFVRQFGDVSETATGPDGEFYRRQKYEKLGLDPNVPPTLTLPPDQHDVYKNFYKAKGELVPSNYGRICYDQWTLENYPMLADWIKEINAPLDAIAGMVQSPIFFVPFWQSRESFESGNPENIYTLFPPEIPMCRKITRIFKARAMFRIAQGDIDGAIDDKLTIHRLGRLLPHGGGLMRYLVGLAIEGVAASISVGANMEHPLSEPQICRLLDGLDTLPPRIPVNDAYEWVRFLALDVVQVCVRDRISLSQLSSLASVGLPYSYGIATYFPCNWNVVYRRMNELHDAMQEPNRQT